MSLAQVVYSLSTNPEFASEWKTDPKIALNKKGLKLSSEEFDFLSMGLKNSANGNGNGVRLSDLSLMHRGWM